jgi:Fur family ferric uptake transcriptional regulator
VNQRADELRQKGLRLTPQRELVLQAVRELGHATPEEVAESVRKSHPGINLSTIYRNLETLENVGLVKHAHLGDAPLESAASFVSNLIDEYGFKTDVTHFAIYGTCANCSDKT